MTITFRNYNHLEDYQRISCFLIRNFQPGNADGNWLEPAWEYMHGHPALEPQFLAHIGIWEEAGEIVAATNYETSLGEAFFQFKPGYEVLQVEMLDYAEANLVDENGRLHAFVNDTNPTFTQLIKERGYVHKPIGDRPVCQFIIPEDFPKTPLPQGFRLLSLADEPDWNKVHKVMYRGFNHPGDPEVNPENKAMRQKMFDTVSADRELKIVVAAPNGDFVAICGMFYQPEGRYGYVEPVATDPDYRRRGLGKAAVLEGIRRCGQRGAVEAFVGSDQPFYLALGFEPKYISRCWEKNK